MPISEQRKADLERRLPPAETTRSRIRQYLLRGDIDQRVFCKSIGYAVPTLTAFMKGTYTNLGNRISSDVLFREAAESYMELHPLSGADVQGRLYETENVAQMRHWFDFCQQNRALAFVYGPPGSQKTFVFEHLIAEFNRRELALEGSSNRAYYVRASVNIQPRDMIAKLCVASGAQTFASQQRCMSSLRHHLRETKTVFVLDEAQLCGIPALEALRELHDVDPRIGCLLAGSHTLKKFFDQRAAELEQWNSRLEAGVELGGVSDATARAILQAECPDLDPDQITEMINGSRVQDIYSRDRNRTYLNMRRLFKNIAAVHRLSAEAEGAAQ